jgi:hypothetical protein
LIEISVFILTLYSPPPNAVGVRHSGEDGRGLLLNVSFYISLKLWASKL